MKITETLVTHCKNITVHWQGIDDKTHQKCVEIHKNDEGELLSVTIGNKEITGLELDILEFLKKQGELEAEPE